MMTSLYGVDCVDGKWFMDKTYHPAIYEFAQDDIECDGFEVTTSSTLPVCGQLPEALYYRLCRCVGINPPGRNAVSCCLFPLQT